jgi:hypothetical protein
LATAVRGFIAAPPPPPPPPPPAGATGADSADDEDDDEPSESSDSIAQPRLGIRQAAVIHFMDSDIDDSFDGNDRQSYRRSKAVRDAARHHRSRIEPMAVRVDRFRSSPSHALV